MPLDCFCNTEEKLAANGMYWLASMLFQVGYIYSALQKAGPSGYVKNMSIYPCSAARQNKSKTEQVCFVPRGGQKTTDTGQSGAGATVQNPRVSQNDSIEISMRCVSHTHTCNSL